MSIELVVGGTVYNFPVTNQDPNWAEEVSGWAEAVTNVLDTIVGTGDISLTNFPLDNAQTGSFANINGFLFDQTQVRAVSATYRIQRTDGSTYLVEKGNIELVYNPQTAAWSMQRDIVGDAKVYIDVTSTGQLQYKVISLPGQTDGFIRFETVSTLT